MVKKEYFSEHFAKILNFVSISPKYLQNIPPPDYDYVALTHIRAASRNGNAVVVIITRFDQFEQDCHPRVYSRWQVDKEAFENPTHIIYAYSTIYELFGDVVFKHATLPTAQGPSRNGGK